MKTQLAIAMMAFAMIGCGQFSTGERGPQGLPGQDAPTLVDFEGYYELPNGGWADVYQDAQGLINVRSMRLIVKNADGSSALIPVTGVPGLPQVNGTVYYRLHVNYVFSSHNLKNDLDNSVISGAMLTEIRLSMSGQKLKVTTVVHGPFSLVYLGNVESL